MNVYNRANSINLYTFKRKCRTIGILQIIGTLGADKSPYLYSPMGVSAQYLIHQINLKMRMISEIPKREPLQ